VKDQPVVDIIKSNKLQPFGHTCRMSEMDSRRFYLYTSFIHQKW